MSPFLFDPGRGQALAAAPERHPRLIELRVRPLQRLEPEADGPLQARGQQARVVGCCPHNTNSYVDPSFFFEAPPLLPHLSLSPAIHIAGGRLAITGCLAEPRLPPPPPPPPPPPTELDEMMARMMAMGLMTAEPSPKGSAEEVKAGYGDEGEDDEEEGMEEGGGDVAGMAATAPPVVLVEGVGARPTLSKVEVVGGKVSPVRGGGRMYARMALRDPFPLGLLALLNSWPAHP